MLYFRSSARNHPGRLSRKTGIVPTRTANGWGCYKLLLIKEKMPGRGANSACFKGPNERGQRRVESSTLAPVGSM